MEKKPVARLSLLTVLLMLAYSGMMAQVRGNGNVVTEERKVDDFNRIVVRSGIDLMLSQGDREKLEIRADENLQEYIVSEVRNNTLYINVDEKTNILGSRAMDALVVVRNIEFLRLSGGGDLQTQSVISSDDISVEVSGGGDMEIELTANRAGFNISGGGDMELRGRISSLEASLSGGGDMELDADLGTLDVKISGGGDAEISCGDEASDVTAKISGGGDLDLDIQAEKLTVSVGGGGDVMLRGSAGDLICQVSSGGDLSAGGFKARNANLKITGGSDAHINVSEKLDVSASGGGEIHVSGGPVIEAKLSGGSKIYKR